MSPNHQSLRVKSSSSTIMCVLHDVCSSIQPHEGFIEAGRFAFTSVQMSLWYWNTVLNSFHIIQTSELCIGEYFPFSLFECLFICLFFFFLLEMTFLSAKSGLLKISSCRQINNWEDESFTPCCYQNSATGQYPVGVMKQTYLFCRKTEQLMYFSSVRPTCPVFATLQINT